MLNKSNLASLSIDELVERAKEGSKDTLEEIILRIQDGVYGLALRMLFIPADAEDAAQEILTKTVIHLGSFRGESSFTTWVYKIASNHLLSMRKARAEHWEMKFETCVHAIEETAGDAGNPFAANPEQNLIVEETKRSCLLYLLLCLSRKLRIAVILGEILGLNGPEAGEILGMSPAAFRRQLSRGRKQIAGFMAEYCGLVGSENPCRCDKLAAYHVRQKYIDPKRLSFAVHSCRPGESGIGEALSTEMDRLTRAVVLIRNQPDYRAPGVFVESMRNLLRSGSFKLLD